MYKDLLFIWLLILLAREEFLKNCGTGATFGAQLPGRRKGKNSGKIETQDPTEIKR